MRMLDNRLLVRPHRNSELSDGGIYTGRPTTTFVANRDKAEQYCCGQIVAMGPGKRHPRTGVRLPMGVEVGQYIAFSDTCHRSVEVEGEELLTLKNDDIMLISDEPINNCEVLY